MINEVWAFIKIEERRHREIADKMLSEAIRVSTEIGAVPCGVLFESDEKNYMFNHLENFRSIGVSKFYIVRGNHAKLNKEKSQGLKDLLLKQKPKAILFPNSATDGEIAAYLASELGTHIITNCITVKFNENILTANRSIMGNKAHIKLQYQSNFPYIVTFDQNSLESGEKISSKQPEAVYKDHFFDNSGKTDSDMTLMETWKLPFSDIDISEAEIVIGIGAGIDRPQFLDAINTLAELLDAAVGGTRIAVFNGIVPRDNQIGSTGKLISPNLYIPIGISGASHHLMGIQKAKKIISINTDKNAPINKKANVCVVGDLYKVVPELIDGLKSMLQG